MHPWNHAHFAQLAGLRARLPHALLLHGPRGVGKFALAQALAQGLLCEAPHADGRACGQCDACNWFVQGNHPDFRLLQPLLPEEAEEGDNEGADKDGASAGGKPGKRTLPIIKVDRVREVTAFVQLSTHRGGWRIALIHPAETMNGEAANALLKTLEEPPPGVLLILVSHQIGRLLPTVVSRCRKVHIGLPDARAALAWLRTQDVDDAEALLAEAGGAPLAALDFAEPERGAQREAFLDALTQGARLDVCDLAQRYQAQLADAWGWLSRWVHDLIAQRLAGTPRYFAARATQTAALGQRADLTRLLELQRELAQAGRWLRHPLNATLLLESWLIRYSQLAPERGK